jgi:hypothetical protein
MTTTPETAKPRFAPQMPSELLASSTFLLKRLGFAAKDQALASYEETGLHPYHYAIMLVLDEGSRETQGSIADALGYDRGQLVGLLDELAGAGPRRAPARSQRPPPPSRPDDSEGTKALRRLRALARETRTSSSTR